MMEEFRKRETVIKGGLKATSITRNAKGRNKISSLDFEMKKAEVDGSCCEMKNIKARR